MEITRRLNRLFLAALFLVLAGCPLAAQEGFDKEYTFEQIQDLLRQGIHQRQIRTQALAWYLWAHYNEQNYGRTDSAFQYLARSVDRFQLSTDTLAYHRARADLALWLSHRGMNKQALEMQSDALAYFQRHKQLPHSTLILLQMSRNYMAMGDTIDALKFRRLFRDNNEVLKDTLLEITVLMEEVARLQYEQKYREAINLSVRTLELARQSRHPDYAAQSQYNLGLLSAQDRDFQSALGYLKEAERLYASGDALQRRNIYRQLAHTYAALDSMPAAYDYSMRYAELGDTVRQRDRSAALQRVALQYDSREKTRAIEMLEQEKMVAQSKANEQRLLATALAVGLFAVVLAMFFIIRDYRHRLHSSKVIAQQSEELNLQKIRDLENSMRIESMQSMLEGQENERRRVAHDLHDSLGGLLSAAKLHLAQLAEKIPEQHADPDLLKTKQLIDETVAETRQIARNLQPVSLERFGLQKALRDLVIQMSAKAGPHIDLQFLGQMPPAPQDLLLNFYRIAQELIQNSLKHAQAKEILVQINVNENELHLLVEDDGLGYNPEQQQTGMGTHNIQQRVHFLNGELSIETAPGQGVSTYVSIPF